VVVGVGLGVLVEVLPVVEFFFFLCLDFGGVVVWFVVVPVLGVVPVPVFVVGLVPVPVPVLGFEICAWTTELKPATGMASAIAKDTESRDLVNLLI